MNLPRNTLNPTTPENNLYVELLKNRISDLEKHLTKKNAIINFLTNPTSYEISRHIST